MEQLLPLFTGIIVTLFGAGGAGTGIFLYRVNKQKALVEIERQKAETAKTAIDTKNSTDDVGRKSIESALDRADVENGRLRDRIQALESQIDSIKNELTEANEVNKALREQLQDVEDRNNDLEQRLARLEQTTNISKN